MKASLSIAEARRAALAAQGFSFPSREGKANWTKISKTINRPCTITHMCANAA